MRRIKNSVNGRDIYDVLGITEANYPTVTVSGSSLDPRLRVVATDVLGGVRRWTVTQWGRTANVTEVDQWGRPFWQECDRWVAEMADA